MSIQLYTYISRAIIGLAGLCFATLLPNIAAAEDYTVEINKTKIMHLSAPAGAIIVGNPEIADISIHSPTLLFVLGRGYGVTNVIILDDIGNTILETDIQVGGNQSGSGKRLMMAGQGWRSYDCTPFCQPAPVLGNDPTFLESFKGHGQAIDNTGTPITTTPINGTGANVGVLSSTLPAASVSFANATNQPAPQVQTQQAPPPTASNFGSRRGAEH